MPGTMKHAKEVFSEQFLQMKEKCLSLATDFDRIASAPGGIASVSPDARFQTLQQVLRLVVSLNDQRAMHYLPSSTDDPIPTSDTPDDTK